MFFETSNTSQIVLHKNIYQLKITDTIFSESETVQRFNVKLYNF